MWAWDRMAVKAIVVDSIPTRGNEILNIFIFLALVATQRAALNSATQHATDFGGK